MFEVDFTTPWYELATVHFAATMLVGAVCGYLLKYIIDEMLKRLASKREDVAEQLEDMIDELAMLQAAKAEPLPVNTPRQPMALVYNQSSSNASTTHYKIPKQSVACNAAPAFAAR